MTNPENMTEEIFRKQKIQTKRKSSKDTKKLNETFFSSFFKIVKVGMAHPT